MIETYRRSTSFLTSFIRIYVTQVMYMKYTSEIQYLPYSLLNKNVLTKASRTVVFKVLAFRFPFIESYSPCNFFSIVNQFDNITLENRPLILHIFSFFFGDRLRSENKQKLSISTTDQIFSPQGALPNKTMNRFEVFPFFKDGKNREY